MDSTRGRLLFHLLLIFLNKELRVYSQNVTPRGNSQSSATVVNNNSNGDSNGYVNYNINQGTPTPKLMNTLLTVAATKGVLPEILPALKGTVISDNMQQSPYLPEGAELNRNLFQNQPSKTYITTNIPNYTFQPENLSSTTFSTSVSPSVSWLGPEIFTVTNPTLTGQQSLFTSGITSYDISPSYQSNQPSFSSLQYQPMDTQTNNYPFALNTLTEFNPTQQNIQTKEIPAVFQADQSLPPVSEVVTENTQLDSLQTIITTDDNGQKLPIEIHINMPSPNMSTPKIAIVSITPANIPNSQATDDLPAFEYPPQPIIIESSKSKSKLWLPILLMSLLSNDNGRGSCGCACSCSCNNSANNVPIPFPIPIPMNNPVVATGNYRCSTKIDSS